MAHVQLQTLILSPHRTSLCSPVPMPGHRIPPAGHYNLVQAHCVGLCLTLPTPAPPCPVAQVTASHQLATAIQTLSLCVRPMLIAGLPLDGAEAGGGGEGELSGEAGAP